MPRRSTSSSWGFAIRRMIDEELIAFGGIGYKCAGKCPEKATFENSYNYITGRAGNTSRRRVPACRTHAEKFAAKHGLEMPAESAVRQLNATEQMFRAAGFTPGHGPTAAAVAALFADVAARYPELELPGRLCDYTLACRTCEMPMTTDGHIGTPCTHPAPAPIYGWSAENRALFHWPQAERADRPVDALYWWRQQFTVSPAQPRPAGA